MRHVVDTIKEEWYHLDDDFRVWTCGCLEGREVSLCLTLDESLKKEGELRGLNRKIAEKRKLLGLKHNEELT